MTAQTKPFEVGQFTAHIQPSGERAICSRFVPGMYRLRHEERTSRGAGSQMTKKERERSRSKKKTLTNRNCCQTENA